MTTLRIKSENGTLKCEYSEMVKPTPDSCISFKWYKEEFEKHESSFQPITLSEEAMLFIEKEFSNPLRIAKTAEYKDSYVELIGKETECFEVKQKVKSGTMQQHQIGEAGYTYFQLHLKSVPVAENVPQINSQTKCPTCGSTVTVGCDGTSQFYIPIENVVAGDGMKTAEEVFSKVNGFSGIGNNESVTLTKRNIFDAMESYSAHQLKSMLEEILKHECEMYSPALRVEVVPVSDIRKVFEKAWVNLESKTEF